jgi:anti-anti-sigma regulatory factor
VEYRRDLLDVLLGPLGATDRARALAQLGAYNDTQRLKITYGEAVPAAAGARIFTSHRDRVTTIHVRGTAGTAGTAGAALQIALDHGMHAGEPLLVVDLADVPVLDVAGLDVLAGAASLAARRQKWISVRGAQPAVFEQLVAAGLVAVLDVHPARRTPRERGAP